MRIDRPILHMAQIMREWQIRIFENKLKNYNKGSKVHKIQLDFHKDKHRNRWVFGGNRTGKTECGAVEALWYARGNHPYRNITGPTRGWVVSLSAQVQRDVAQRKLLSYIPKKWIAGAVMRSGRADDMENGIIDILKIKSIHGGISTIGFRTCEQGREKFQGTSRHWIWFDEEPTEEIYRECMMRIIDTRGDIWGTMTPLKGLTWVYDRIYINKFGNSEIKAFRMSWRDNPWLSSEEIIMLESSLPKDEREARQHGKFTALTGMVYREFDPDIHVIPPFDMPSDWAVGISIDPGLAAPLSCHFYASDYDGNIYVVAEHYECEWSIEAHAAEIHRIADSLDWPRDGSGRLRAIVDSAANQRTLSGERSVVELFYDHGLILNTKVIKDRWSGIQRVKQYLLPRPHPNIKTWPRGKPKLFIFENCPMMIREMKGYRWASSGDGPIKRDDHAMDDLRYFIMTRPIGTPMPKAPKTMIEKDKDRLSKIYNRKRH